MTTSKRPHKLQQIVIILCLIVVTLVLYLLPSNVENQTILEEYQTDSDSKYIIDLQGCRIPRVRDLNATVMKKYFPLLNTTCKNTSLPFLFETMILNDRTCPDLNKHILKSVYKSEEKYLKCSYQEVYDNKSAKIPDHTYILGEKTNFDWRDCPNETLLWITCTLSEGVVQNYEQPLFLTKVFPQNQATFPNREGETPLNVLVIGIDSVSRLAFLRTMDKTLKFLRKTYARSGKLLEFIAYNKIGENSAPNQIPLLTGKKFDYDKDMLEEYFDNYTRYLWDDFSDKGFRTMFMEEQWYFGLFTYPTRIGFMKSPTLYWPRPLMMIIDSKYKQHYLNPKCVGGHFPNHYYTKYLIDTLQLLGGERPLFSYSWWSDMVHDSQNGVRYLDNTMVETFQKMQSENILNNSVIIFLADHGFRIGGYRHTSQGAFEDNLPFLYILLPQKFLDIRPQAAKIAEINTKRLVTAFDIHATLLDLSDMFSEGRTVKTSNGVSILGEEIPASRTCEDAQIPDHFCSCIEYQPVIMNKYSEQGSANQRMARIAAQKIIEAANEILEAHDNFTDCSWLSFESVTNIQQMVNGKTVLPKYKISIKAQPSPVALETIFLLKDSKVIINPRDIVRVDEYSKHSLCAARQIYEKYCYCKYKLK